MIRHAWLPILLALVTGCESEPDDKGGDSGQPATTAPGTGGTGSTATGGGATGTGTGGTTADHPITALGLGSVEIPPGSDYLPMAADGIPPYSFARNLLELRNDSDAAVTLDGIDLTPVGDTLDLELTVIDYGEAAPTPVDVAGTVLAPGESVTVEIYFYPIESGPRTDDVVVRYDGGGELRFTVSGRGRDAWDLSDAVANTTAQIFGDPDADVLSGASALDAADNLYASGNANEWSDGFSENITVLRMNADGSLGWAREWQEDFEQLSPDPGQNAESGGGPDSLDVADGAVYVVGRRSQSSFNSAFQSLVMRVDADSGDLDWAVGWSPVDADPPSIAWHSSQAYAVDASLPDRVLVVGTSFGEAEVSLFALSKADGSLLWSHQLDLAPGSNDRGYTVAVHGDAAWIGGLTDGRGFVAKVSGVDGARPALDFAHRVDMGVGSNIVDIELDDAGDAYLALDRRGLPTFLSVAKLSAGGDLVWAKTWDDTASTDTNATHTVHVHDGTVYLGGRVGFVTGDTVNGEALLLALDAADGSYQWGAAYYTGKGAEEISEHRVKGIATDSAGDLRLLVQGYTGPLNFEHYWGHWYTLMDDPLADLTLGEDPGDGAALLVDYVPSVTDITADADFHAVDGAYDGRNVATAHPIDTAGLWGTPPATVTWEPMSDREGNGTDADMTLMVLDRG